MKDIFRQSADCRLDYWLKYWRCHIKDLCDLNDYDLQLDSPHFLLKEIITEIKYNDFKNSENRKLFKELLGKVQKLDQVFSELYRTEIGLALKSWDTSPLIVKSICSNILQSMDKCDYLNMIVNKLQNILEGKTKFDEKYKDEICLYTDLLIQELICLGIDIEDIGTFIENENLAIDTDGNVLGCNNSFYELKREDYESEKEYHDAVSARYKNRNAQDYISNILSNFYKEEKDGFVILRLLGVKGSISYQFKDLHLYSIDKATYLPSNNSNDIEKEDSFQFVNVAVKVKHRFLYTSMNYAIRKVNSLLDYLSFNVKCEEGLSISRQFAAIVVDGRVCGSHHSIKDNMECMHNYKILTAFDLTPYNDNLQDWLKEFTDTSDIENETFQKIGNSTHWYSKAVHATKNEDKLLYSWIALESILKVSDSVFKNICPKDCNVLNTSKVLCSSIMARNKFYSYAKNTYLELLTYTQQLGNLFAFKHETIEKARLNLKQGDIIDLSYFFDELPILIDEITNDDYRRKLIKVQSFYESKNGIVAFKNSVCNDIALIYRLRNMIVHNAICPQFIIKLYAHKAQLISGTLIQAIRYYYNEKDVDINDALLGVYLDCQIFENNITAHINRLKSRVAND